MRKSVKVAALVMGIVGLVGCSTGPYRQTYWVNPGVDPKLQQHRLTLDSAECALLADQTIPEPPPPKMTGAYEGGKKMDRELRRREYAVACLAIRGWEQKVRVVEE